MCENVLLSFPNSQALRVSFGGIAPLNPPLRELALIVWERFLMNILAMANRIFLSEN
jgi:hypothetical protein